MINFNDSNKFKTIDDILTTKGEDGKTDLFTDDEKLNFFSDSRIAGDIEKYREVAALLEKIKRAKKTFKEDKVLHDSIKESRQPTKTVAYQVVNSKDGAVEDALDHLRMFFKGDETTDKTEEQIKAQITAWDVEKRKKEILLKDKNSHKKSALKEKKEKLAELSAEQKTVIAKEKLLGILKYDETNFANIDIVTGFDTNGNKQIAKLSTLTIDPTKVNDYSGSNLTDSTLHPYSNAKTLEDLLKDARKHLTNINIHKNSPPQYVKTKLSDAFNQRTHVSKNNLTVPNGYGVSFLKVLKNIGKTKLEELVEKKQGLSSSDKTDLKKIIPSFIDFTSINELRVGKDYESDNKVAEAKSKNFQKSLLQKKLTEFPYKPCPDWENLFLFMSKVLDKNVSVDLIKDVEPTGNMKSSEGGWKGVKINGFYKGNSDIGTAESMIKYAKENKTSDPVLFSQISAFELEANKNFKSLISIWWDIFDSAFIDSTTSKWNTSMQGEKAGFETIQARLQEELRFAKTMREILKAAGVIKNIDELDYLLLDIADKAEKGGWKNYLQSSNKIYINDFRSEIIKKTIWKDTVGISGTNLINFNLLSDNIAEHELNISILKSDVERIDKLINDISSEQNELDIAIRDYDSKIATFTRALDSFKKDPVDKNITDFNDLWAQKDSQNNKWTRFQILCLKLLIDNIKTKLETDKYNDGGYEAKKTQLTDIEKEVAKYTNDESLFQSFGDTDTERVKKILAEKAKTGFTLEKAKAAYDGIAQHVKLSETEQHALDEINKGIAKPQDYKDDGKSTLKEAELRTALHASGISGTELKLNKWQGSESGSFNNKTKITELIGDYYQGSGKPEEGSFKEHLEHTQWGTKKIGGDNYWKDFVKKGPEFIIGAIRHYEWEHGKGKWTGKVKDKTVTDEMTANNDAAKAKQNNLKITENWDTNKPTHIAEFLYRKEIGKSGKDLIGKKKWSGSKARWSNKNTDKRRR